MNVQKVAVFAFLEGLNLCFGKFQFSTKAKIHENLSKCQFFKFLQCDGPIFKVDNTDFYPSVFSFLISYFFRFFSGKRGSTPAAIQKAILSSDRQGLL